LPEIQDGNYRDEADSVSSIKQKCFCDTGAKLGRKKKKTPRRNKTPSPQTPSSYEASLYHIILRKQEGSHVKGCWLQDLLGRHRTTGEQIRVMLYSHCYPWDKPS
jgi:hypothetical protein